MGSLSKNSIELSANEGIKSTINDWPRQQYVWHWLIGGPSVTKKNQEEVTRRNCANEQKKVRIAVGLLTGHCLNKYLRTIDVVENPT